MNRSVAKSALIFYIKTLWQAAGLNWTADNQAEVCSIIDAIFDEIKEH